MPDVLAASDVSDKSDASVLMCFDVSYVIRDVSDHIVSDVSDVSGVSDMSDVSNASNISDVSHASNFSDVSETCTVA